MDTSLMLLGIAQALSLLIYRWVGAVFISQPRFNHPMIFHNPKARTVLFYGPMLASVIFVVLAFILTDSPWLFLGLTVAGFVAFSARPNADLMR